MSTTDEREYLDAITEILTIFDDDTEMTGDILACPPDQHTAESAALVKIREIGRRVMEGRGTATGDAAAGHAAGNGYFAEIAFMGHIEHTGYVTEIVKNGQPAYHIDLPDKLWGGDPLSWVEHAASAWFSERPMSEESVRKAWMAERQRAAARARQQAEWQRMQEQRAITAGDDDEDLDDEDRPAF